MQRWFKKFTVIHKYPYLPTAFGRRSFCELVKTKNTMKNFTSVLLFLALIAFMGCHSHPTDPRLEEAFQFHKEALAVNKAIQDQLQSIKNDSLNVVSQLQKRLQVWEENLVEVPGFEHDHDHSHGGHHHHHHGTEVEVTPEHMINIQKEFLDSIRVIQQEVQLYLGQ